MARSRPETKAKAKASLSEAKPGCPKVRLYWERHPVTVDCDPEEGRTHQSFKDECDVDKIIDLHTRTGVVTHLNPGKPQYGDCPETSIFEAAVAVAEVRSAMEDGFEFDSEAPEASETSPEGDTPASAPEASEGAPEAPKTATEG